ncbi:MAG: hypothetical protein RML56_09440 [Burkholderiales bacterium]|nr:hypothetical protein [Burkholderiales bacterium]
MDDYRHFFADPTTLAAQLDGLARLHGRARVAEWKALAASGEWRALVARLLEEHYDPAYRRSSQAHYARLGEARRLAIDSSEPTAFAAAAEELAREARATV